MPEAEYLVKPGMAVGALVGVGGGGLVGVGGGGLVGVGAWTAGPAPQAAVIMDINTKITTDDLCILFISFSLVWCQVACFIGLATWHLFS